MIKEHMRDFLIKITDLDDKVIGELEISNMGANNDFVDIISYAYHNRRRCAYKNFPRYKIFPRRTGEQITFIVAVLKIDTLGRKRLVSTMDVGLEEDSSFDEILDMCYHGCTDN